MYRHTWAKGNLERESTSAKARERERKRAKFKAQKGARKGSAGSAKAQARRLKKKAVPSSVFLMCVPMAGLQRPP